MLKVFFRLGYFFFPLNVNDTLLNRDFYTYLPDYYTENAAIGANIMDLKSGSYNYIGLDSDDPSKRVFEMSYAKAFKMYSVNLESVIKKYNSENVLEEWRIFIETVVKKQKG